MKNARRRVSINPLKSKVARRVFLLFIVCALLPLSAMALFSYLNVRNELNTQLSRRLQQASKSAGMTVIERLSFLDNDLQQIIAHLPDLEGKNAAALPDNLEKRAGQRFRGLAIATEDGRILSSLFGSVGVIPALTNGDRLHLWRGETLVTTSRGEQGEVMGFVARMVDPAQPELGCLFGAIKGEYVWGGDGFVAPPTEFAIFDQAGQVLFSNSAGGAAPTRAVEEAQTNSPMGQFEWSHDGDAYVASYWTLFMRPVFLNSWMIALSERKADILAPLQNFALTFTLVVLLTFWVATLLSFNQIRRNLVPIEVLKDATLKIRDGQLSHRVRVGSHDEFAELGASFNEMTESLENHVRVMGTINGIGLSLSVEKDTARLLDIVLSGAQAVFRADGAILFLTSADERLDLAMVRIASLRISLDGGSPEELRALAGGPGSDAGALWEAAGAMERTLRTPDVHAERDGAFAPQLEFDRLTGYRSRSFLSIPLRNHDDEVIGVLQLVNATASEVRDIVPFSAEDQRLAESLASQVAVALTKNRLVSDFKGLFEGLTELISEAIDQKSAYTGGHVRRVVDLAMMIAAAARTSGNEALCNFAASEDELYELRIAALLHDCGKIATPVHIQDKGTKLEAICDRINLIGARAEILRRDRRIELLEGALRRVADGSSPDLLSNIARQADAFDRKLEDDVQLLRRSNMGREHMPERLQARVRAIASKYAWVDASQHRELLVTDEELKHLTIPSGTLTGEERQIVDRHVVATIRMLEKLPYPKKLRHIPAYAGAHHERMDGKGYPNGLTREAIPIAGRIIGIADIFEALTASDRPYKKAKSLDEAMRILREMAESGHIDPDLYEVFVREQVHLRYAAAHLGAKPAAGTDPAGQADAAGRQASDEALVL